MQFYVADPFLFVLLAQKLSPRSENGLKILHFFFLVLLNVVFDARLGLRDLSFTSRLKFSVRHMFSLSAKFLCTTAVLVSRAWCSIERAFLPHQEFIF